MAWAQDELDIVALAHKHGLEAERAEDGRIAITSPEENLDALVLFINDGPEDIWDYELTTSEWTGVPIVFVGVN
jgi:hypothetical protein